MSTQITDLQVPHHCIHVTQRWIYDV